MGIYLTVKGDSQFKVGTEIRGDSSFSPFIIRKYSELPVFNGNLLWLDGSDKSTMFDSLNGGSEISNGDPVYRWEDKSDNENHAVAVSGSPLIHVPSFQNGNSALSSSFGTWYYLTAPLGSVGGFSDVVRTAFVVSRAENATDRYIPFLGTSDNSPWIGGYNGEILGNLAAAGIRNGDHYLNGSSSNFTSINKQTSLSVHAIVTTGTGYDVDQIIRDRTYDDRCWFGELAEIVLYDRVLSPIEVKKMNDYFLNKWGI